MTELSVELLFFNDVKNLKRLIPTIIDEVVEVLALDGRHTNFKSYDELSSDGSREYLKQFDNIRLIDCPNMYHVEKRILAKELCKTHTLLILDSDEYIVGDWDVFRESYEKARLNDVNHVDSYAMKIQYLNIEDRFYNLPLVYYNPSQFTYYNGKHNIPIKKTLSSNPNIFAPIYIPKPLEGLVVMHDHKLRDGKHMEIRKLQRKWQDMYEK